MVIATVMILVMERKGEDDIDVDVVDLFYNFILGLKIIFANRNNEKKLQQATLRRES